MFGFEVSELWNVQSLLYLVGISGFASAICSAIWCRKTLQKERKEAYRTDGKTVRITPSELADLHFKNSELEDQVNDLQSEVADQNRLLRHDDRLFEQFNQDHKRVLEANVGLVKALSTKTFRLHGNCIECKTLAAMIAEHKTECPKVSSPLARYWERQLFPGKIIDTNENNFNWLYNQCRHEILNTNSVSC